MKIGIVSDSHGKADRLRRALALLVHRGAQAIVHCGDLGSEECLAELAQAGVPAYAVVGNMDRHPERLQQQARILGVHLGPEIVAVPLGGDRTLAATHGNKAQVMAHLLAGGKCHYVCHGHTHSRRDEHIGQTHVINPGALHHAHPQTVALLDAATDTVEFIEVR